jgi:hypothetical protein
MQTPPDFLIDPVGFILFYASLLLPYIVLVATLLVLMLVYLVVTRLAKRSLKDVGMGVEASTGIVLILRLVFFIIAVMIIIGQFEASLAAVLSISTIFGTAIGLAFSQAIGNIVSGLYVLVARPFRVGDYVRIANIEGIVREITLNYTRMLLSDETTQLVPNNKVVSSEVTNFRIDVSQLVKEKKEEQEQEEGRRGGAWRYIRSLDNAVDRLQEMTGGTTAYRYTFDLSLHMSYDHIMMQKKFDDVCRKWEKEMLLRPTYFIWSKPSAAITYRFVMIVDDPMFIIKRSSDFLGDLLEPFVDGSGKFQAE